MVYIQSQEITEEEFKSLLEKTKVLCLKEIQEKRHKTLDGVSFENLVSEQMVIAAIGTKFAGEIQQTGPQTFPDIIAKKYYGIEVKVTAEDKWISTGNSVLETTRRPDVERIYMFFCKFKEQVAIKYRPYQECLVEVAVTHSPRYKIDMNLPKGSSIFDKIELDYDSLRKEDNPIQKFKNYYRKHLKDGEELWWIDPGAEINDKPSIRFLNKFEKDEQRDFVINSMIFFPEIFGNNGKSKFQRTAAFLLNDYKAISYNLRDFFTSKGTVDLNIGKKTLKAPRIFSHLFKNAKEIQKRIHLLPEDKLFFNWKVAKVKEPKIEYWKKQLDIYGSSNLKKINASKIFEAGLK